ncbi:uncharacterized protein LOC109849700 isoform X2 [Asparagus officinalis]|uniref:uncharacterized protein LOC109849700 isoform X2 n=1 Tax=Asparagus officinalis TaxID=4686 RepID=UPI00098DEAFA|nr:uncharacterized protein LOC109849700 isoform X2 [Asparagus officinalis]
MLDEDDTDTEQMRWYYYLLLSVVDVKANFLGIKLIITVLQTDVFFCTMIKMSKFAFFPQWPKPKPPRDLATVVPNLESTGLDLLSDVQDLATVVLLRIKCFSMNQLKESLLGMLLSTNTSRNVRILEWYHDFDRLSSNCILVYSLIKKALTILFGICSALVLMILRKCCP